MNVEIVSIVKKEKNLYDSLSKEFIKMINRFAKVTDTEVFNKDITKAHAISADAAQKAYTKILTPHISSCYSVVLDPGGKIIDSFEFSKLLDGKMSVKFFIGGAYGFDQDFLQKSDVVISLGKITMAHKIVKIVLLEQIYRGFSILSNHPYHK